MGSSALPNLVQRQCSQKVVLQEVLNLSLEDVSPGDQPGSCAHKMWPHWKFSLKFGPKNMSLVNWSIRCAHKRWPQVKCSLKLGLEDMF